MNELISKIEDLDILASNDISNILNDNISKNDENTLMYLTTRNTINIDVINNLSRKQLVLLLLARESHIHSIMEEIENEKERQDNA